MKKYRTDGLCFASNENAMQTTKNIQSGKWKSERRDIFESSILFLIFLLGNLNKSPDYKNEIRHCHSGLLQNRWFVSERRCLFSFFSMGYVFVCVCVHSIENCVYFSAVGRLANIRRSKVKIAAADSEIIKSCEPHSIQDIEFGALFQDRFTTNSNSDRTNAKFNWKTNSLSHIASALSDIVWPFSR